MPAVALSAMGVAKHYRRGVLVLNGVDLTIARGSITGLVGPNGAGKSTLIKAWIGFERPSRGEVRVMDLDPWRDRSGALRMIGYVPQASALYRAITVADHLSLAVSARNDFDRELARLRLGQLGIRMDAVCGTLSGGQQAQVSLALALGTRAPVLLLDEPLAHLDPLARREFLQVLVEDVHANGTTALLSSHVVSDIAQSCDHLVVLSAGKKLLDDRIDHALSGHRVLSGAVSKAHAVASFLDESHKPATLVADNAGGRPATLDDIVLGYLATSREHPEIGMPFDRDADRADGASPQQLVALDDTQGVFVVTRTGTPVSEIVALLAGGRSPSEAAHALQLSRDEVTASLHCAADLARRRLT